MPQKGNRCANVENPAVRQALARVVKNPAGVRCARPFRFVLRFADAAAAACGAGGAFARARLSQFPDARFDVALKSLMHKANSMLEIGDRALKHVSGRSINE